LNRERLQKVIAYLIPLWYTTEGYKLRFFGEQWA